MRPARASSTASFTPVPPSTTLFTPATTCSHLFTSCSQLYDAEAKARYRSGKWDQLEPHVYGIAELAFTHMVSNAQVYNFLLVIHFSLLVNTFLVYSASIILSPIYYT